MWNHVFCRFSDYLAYLARIAFSVAKERCLKTGFHGRDGDHKDLGWANQDKATWFHQASGKWVFQVLVICLASVERTGSQCGTIWAAQMQEYGLKAEQTLGHSCFKPNATKHRQDSPPADVRIAV